MTNAELAILSLVAEQPRHGYEIEAVIEERGMRQWTEIGFSSIYYLLRKLETNGLVRKEQQKAGRGPARNVYAATPAGRDALREGVRQALSEPGMCYPALLLGLANQPVLDPAEAVAALNVYRDVLQERQTQLEAATLTPPDAPPFVTAMFDYSLALLRAELEWITGYLAQLSRDG